jgi:hypothetical protein
MYSLDDLGTFVSLRPSEATLDALEALQASMGLTSPVLRDALHCTVVDSSKTMRGYTAWGELYPSIHAEPVMLAVWPWMEDRECVVLQLKSEDIVLRNQRLCDVYHVPAGKYPFIPHITLGYGTESETVRLLSPSVLQAVIPRVSFVKEYSIACCSEVRDHILKNLNTDSPL